MPKQVEECGYHPLYNKVNFPLCMTNWELKVLSKSPWYCSSLRGCLSFLTWGLKRQINMWHAKALLSKKYNARHILNNYLKIILFFCIFQDLGAFIGWICIISIKIVRNIWPHAQAQKHIVGPGPGWPLGDPVWQLGDPRVTQDDPWVTQDDPLVTQDDPLVPLEDTLVTPGGILKTDLSSSKQ